MRHDLSMEGHALRLRPIADSDASFVLELRGNPELNRHLHAGALDITQQLAWFRDYYARADDYYFVIERRRNAASEGLIALYDITGGCGEWGRWILRPGSPAAVESAWLIYRIGFERLGLESMYCRTVAANEKVVSFHDSCGIEARRVLPGHFDLGGQRCDAIEHRLDRAAWAHLAPRLEQLARAVARRGGHG